MKTSNRLAVLALIAVLAAAGAAASCSHKAADISPPLPQKIDAIESSLRSDAYTPLAETDLSLPDFARLIGTAYKTTATPDDTGRSVSYQTTAGAYRAVPKAAFTLNAQRYVAFDALKKNADGTVEDCQICSGDLSVLRYGGEAGAPVIGKLWPHISKSGVYGDTGAVIPVSFKDGGIGFVTTNGLSIQGENNNWINAYRIDGDAITEDKALAKSVTTPPSP